MAKPLHVVIDPGHGGADRGATRGKVQEADITLKVSLMLAHLLRRDPDFEVSLTRTKDSTLSLSERTRFARRTKADLFVSIHVNSSVDPRAHGVEFYFQNQLPPDEESMFLANKENQDEDLEKLDFYIPDTIDTAGLSNDVIHIIEDLVRNWRIRSSSQLSQWFSKTWTGTRKSKSYTIRQAPFFVVKHSPTPSALVELGFLSNRHDVKKLVRSSYQSQMARSLHQGLRKFKENMDKAQ